jgi:hypothetical protein
MKEARRQTANLRGGFALPTSRTRSMRRASRDLRAREYETKCQQYRLQSCGAGGISIGNLRAGKRGL